MSTRKNIFKNLTAESILAERAKKKEIHDEIERLRRERESSSTSEEDEVLKKYACQSNNESNDLNFTFKNYGHTIFSEPALLSEDELLKHLEENDRYIFMSLLHYGFWKKMSSRFADQPLHISERIFKLMANVPECTDLCKQYLLSDSNTWVPSYNDIASVMQCWGASEDLIGVPVSCKMEYEESVETGSLNSCSMSGTPSTLSSQSSCKMSDDQIKLILTTFEYLSLALKKSNMSSTDTLSLVTLLLKVSVDKNCTQALSIISIIVNTLLNNLLDFNDILVNNLAQSLLQFETERVNRVFISINVIPRSPRGYQLATRLSFLIIQDILKIKVQAKLINLQSILTIFKKHSDKVKLMNPANIYFFVLSLTNIFAGLNTSSLDTNELSEFLDRIKNIKKLPQIQNRNSNLKFIGNFVEWCITFWDFTLRDKQESQRFESPKKITRTNSR